MCEECRTDPKIKAFYDDPVYQRGYRLFEAALDALIMAASFAADHQDEPLPRSLARLVNPGAGDFYRTILGRLKELPQGTMKPRPTIVCLCGSTRFYEAFQVAYFIETLKGNIVLSVGFYGGSIHGEHVGITPEDKVKLDELHLRKIDIADEVYILNCGGYIGESTRRELEYAEALGKTVRFLEDVGVAA